jgi:hypothetical protein
MTQKTRAHKDEAKSVMTGHGGELHQLAGGTRVEPDEGVVMGEKADVFVTTAANGRVWDREAKVKTVY